jgi:hypothetical protein
MVSALRFSLSSICFSLLLPTVASAQTFPAQTPPLQTPPQGRFSFQAIEGGVMRLDTETGHISICNRAAGDFVCRSVADDRAALDEEITRLKRENTMLRQGNLGSQSNQPKLQLPSEAELDKAMSLFERMMRRMMQTLKDEPPAQNPL